MLRHRGPADRQLGREIVEQLEAQGATVQAVGREACDVTATASVARVFDEAEPDVVYNAAGFTLVDQAESVRSRVMRINGIGAGIVAAHARRAGARLVYFSSDYVFGDGHHAPIDETQVPDPINVYGASKLWGEQLSLQNNPETCVVRSSALYSPYGRSVVRRMIGVAMSKKQTVTVSDDEFVAPTPTFLAAQAAIALAEQPVVGVFHASTRGACSWFEFVRTLVERLELEIDVQPITQERWGAPARRPSYCALDNLMLRTLGLDRFPEWDVALDIFLERNGERIIWEVS